MLCLCQNQHNMICFFLFYRWRSGYRLRKGPIYMTDVFFDDFADNEYYNMGAIGFDKQFKQSAFHSSVNMKFGFSDVSLCVIMKIMLK